MRWSDERDDAHVCQPMLYTDLIRRQSRNATEMRYLVPTLGDKAKRTHIAAAFVPLLYSGTNCSEAFRTGVAAQGNFALKATKNSGCIAIVSRWRVIGQKLQCNGDTIPQTLDFRAFRSVCSSFLNAKFEYRYQTTQEVMVEQLMTKEDGQPWDDFKCFMCHGRVAAMLHVASRFGSRNAIEGGPSKTDSLYDAHGRAMYRSLIRRQYSLQSLEPSTVRTFADECRRIGARYPYTVRIDLLVHDRRAVVNEFALNSFQGARWIDPYADKLMYETCETTDTPARGNDPIRR